ncbi:MAG: amino acid ABC transporter permease [Victivallales bacterium]|nr:amino acid ABC transporter permease [Victivallales bacterium]
MNFLLSLYTFWKGAIERTFIIDNRYRIFLDGIKNTLVITVGALLVGVIIGVAVAISKVYYHQVGPYTIMGSLKLFFKHRRIEFLGHLLLRLWDGVLNVYLTLFRGTPVVVQLMIWSFVIFATADGIIVAIIGFGVNSGAYVAEIVRAGIMAVDKGQTEAGRSLGLSAAATMRLIVLPQAFKNVLPALSNELIALLKETSIVGYIAVVDITKAAALVRARTFDAFIPLMFVSAFYLLMVTILTFFQRMLEKKLQASDRK